MEQNKAENYVVFVNRTFMKDFIIWSAVLAAVLYASTIYQILFYPGVAFAAYLGSNVMFLLVTGLRIPGYQQALNQYTSDKVAKKAMIASYDSIKASKPFALSTKKHLISAGVGVALGFLAYLSVITS
jgi:uncharacterized membrane protein